MGILDVLKEIMHTGSQCMYCNQEIPDGATVCGVCAKEEKRLRNKSANSDDVFFVYHYESIIKKLIYAYKYHDMPRFGPIMAGQMKQYFEKQCAGLRADCISFVPVHPNKRRQRGFDQAELLAVHFGLQVNLPCMALLERVRDTAPQFELTASERAQNIKGAFRATGSAHAGKTILLIDDIYTTGSTMNECIKQLTGAKEIYPFTFARE